MEPLLSLALSGVVALAAWRCHALTGFGALAAASVGMAVLSGTGWPGAIALVTFFLGSTAVSRLNPDATAALLDTRGNGRDAWQVYANGGAAALGALLAADVPGLGIWIVTASLAEAAADTWATSLGGRSANPPRSILTWRPVRPGASGGVTELGTGGALLGAATVAGAGSIAVHDFRLLAAGMAIGFLGMLVDSTLGAGLQGRFHCPACSQDTERRIHRCGTRSEKRGGLSWLTNDAVNASSTTLAALAGWGTWLWLSAP